MLFQVYFLQDARGPESGNDAPDSPPGAAAGDRTGRRVLHALSRPPTFRSPANAGLSGCSGGGRRPSRTRAGPGVHGVVARGATGCGLVVPGAGRVE